MNICVPHIFDQSMSSKCITLSCSNLEYKRDPDLVVTTEFDNKKEYLSSYLETKSLILSGVNSSSSKPVTNLPLAFFKPTFLE